jgi:molybdopterin molybdotransferase
MKTFIGFEEALDLTLASLPASESERLPLHALDGRILAEEIAAQVNCPSLSTSRKDGFAVVAADLVHAGNLKPVPLTIVGQIAAGDQTRPAIRRGQTVRVTTGAPLPDGANAVLAEEFCEQHGNQIIAYQKAEAGRNIHPKGADIQRDETIARQGAKFDPALIGLLAAAGLADASVFKAPKTVVIATGDEVVLPGDPLEPGKLYASNMVAICAWLARYGLPYANTLVLDQSAKIENAITQYLPEVDFFITSGGAWGSERDLILKVMQRLGWQGIYHRVRMGPGKPVGFGLLENKPFFCLPGGPSSNEMAFLQLALPALLKMKGDRPDPFPKGSARLSASVQGKKQWTDFVHARLENNEGRRLVHPARLKSKLKSMACKDALIIVPEAFELLEAGAMVDIQLLNSPNHTID